MWCSLWTRARGEEIWRYDPKVDPAKGKDACCDVVNRGVAAWRGKVYVGVLDGRLIALDAATGSEVWSVQTTDPEKAYTITGAPRIVKGKVIIGNGGAEYGVRGYVSAYDAETGEMAWRFYTVPGDPSEPYEQPILERAAETWSNDGEYWKAGGGGTVWDSMAYDPEADLLYIGVGNGSPWSREERSPGGGDNWFLSSIVALRPDTGEYVWHYQTTPGDNWDYTATQHIILTDITLDGTPRKVLLQAPKNGFFYVIDRISGKLISAGKYEPKVNWATHIDMETGRPVENPDAQYTEDEAKLIYPAPYGAHNWQPMAYSPDTNLVYIPTMEIPFAYQRDSKTEYHRFNWNLGIDVATQIIDAPQTPDVKKATRALVRGSVLAWDPVEQREVWRIAQDHAWNGGLLATAGNLIFQGSGGYFSAHRADTGQKLWDFFAQTGIIAPPVTYELDGQQYVTVQAGYGGAFALASGVELPISEHHKLGRVLTFKLGASGELPAISAEMVAIPEPPDSRGGKALSDRGALLYHRHCSVCHGANAVGGGVLGDLRTMDAKTHELFQDIVFKGVYAAKGMVAFSPVMSESDVDAVHAYIIYRARQDYEILKREQQQ